MSRLVYFAAGLGIGVLLGALFAPQARTETRDEARERPAETGYMTAASDTVEPYGDGM